MGNFIMHKPSSFSAGFFLSGEGIQFLVTILVVLLAVLICFVGTRVMVTILFLEISIACGMYTLSVSDRFITYDNVKVLVFLAGLAIGGTILHFSTTLINRLIVKLHLKRLAAFVVAYLIPFCAALFLWYYVVHRIYTGRVLVGVIAAAVFIGGILVRKKSGMLKQDIEQFEGS